MAGTYFDGVKSTIYWNKTVANIVTRAKFPQKLLENRVLYHPYIVKDGERADTVAFYYYDDANFDWLIFLANNITDPVRDWPLSQEQFERFIVSQYGNIVDAIEEIACYKLKDNVSPISSALFGSLPSYQQRYWLPDLLTQSTSQYLFADRGLKITPSYYDMLPGPEKSYWRALSAYDNHFEENESKRVIRLIDAKYANDIEKNLRSLLQQA